ncbi:hypothetical protein MRX96_046464, partial [Rhipicephalus microplus]
TRLLVEWMISMDLDLSDERRLSRVDPVDMIVRCSLDLGVPAVLSFELREARFFRNRRSMKFAFSNEEETWLNERRTNPKSVNRNYYSTLLVSYGVHPPNAPELASTLLGYEDEQQWVRYLATYTDNIYDRGSYIAVQQNVFSLLTDLFKAKSMGKKGIQHLVAWSVFKQLVNHTVSRALPTDSIPRDFCYEHVGKAMPFAITSIYFQTGLFTLFVECVHIEKNFVV